MQNEITEKASQLTVINDGQSMFAVSTSDLESWISDNGEITTENYQDFCDEVEVEGPDEIVGSSPMINFCLALIEAGAASKRF